MGVIEYYAKKKIGQRMSRRWKCDYCREYIPGNISRKHHHIRECDSVPEEVIDQYPQKRPFLSDVVFLIKWAVAFLVVFSIVSIPAGFVFPDGVAGLLGFVGFGVFVYWWWRTWGSGSEDTPATESGS